MKNNSEQPVFPISGSLVDKCSVVDFDPFGLTKREYFAGLAMQGLLSNESVRQIFAANNGTAVPDLIAEHAAQYADALLSELEKQKP